MTGPDATTVCVRGAEVLARNAASPEYSAVIEWLPVASELTAHPTLPATSTFALQPAIAAAPSLKVTVPVGVPAAAVTAAVKVTSWPAELDVDGAESAVAVGAAAATMVYATVGDVLVWKDALPAYTAVSERAPTARLVVVQVATPAASVAAAQPEIAVPSDRNATLPVGVPDPEVTVAVSVTDCPAAAEPAGLAASAVAVAGGATVVTVCVRPGDVLPPCDALPA